MGETFHIIKLGCDKNDVDADVMRGLLMRDGLVEVEDKALADHIIINSCGFITKAKEESINAVLEAVEDYPDAKIHITGCLAERYPQELSRGIPELNSIVGIGHFSDFADIIRQSDKRIWIGDKSLAPDFTVRAVDYFPYGFIKIADGCNTRCSYCAIPLIKGRAQSRPIGDIVQEAKILTQSGIKEINLVAQNTAAYGADLRPKTSLVDLLEKLLGIPEIALIRLLYCYPGYITDELLDLMAREKRIASYLDIPIQHTEAHLLRKMHRQYPDLITPEYFAHLRKKVPNLILRTTLITGFPGESDEDIANAIKFINRVEFDYLGVFTYSAEENTPAASFPHQIDLEAADERSRLIREEQEYISRRRRWQRVGEELPVTVLNPAEEAVDGQYTYLVSSYLNAPGIDFEFLLISKRMLNNGDVVMAKIAGDQTESWRGELI